MRLTYIHQYFNTPDMVGSTRSYEFARRLVARGWDVEMVTTWRDKEYLDGVEKPEMVEGINVHWLHVPYNNSMSYAQRMQSFVKFSYEATIKSVELETDLIFATSTPLTVAVPGVLASKYRNVPFVFEVRDLWPEIPIAMGALKNPVIRRGAYLLEGFAYRNAEHIVALSPGMRDGIVRAGVAENRITVIPNASDNQLFGADPEVGEQFRANHEWLGRRPLLVYAGTVGRANVVEYLANLAFEAMKIDSEIRILVVGGGGQWANVAEKARALKVLGVNFFMMKDVSKKQIPAVLSAATAACSVFRDIPELHANSANKFFDALAAGKPVLVNYGGWQKEVLEKAGAGMVLHPRDLVSAARELCTLMRDTERLRAMGRAAKHLALSEFDRDLLTDRLEKVLLSAIARR